MTDKAPKRIWAAQGASTGATMWWPDNAAGVGVEYIRADLALVAEAYEVAARECEGSNLGLDPADVADDIRALTPADAIAARSARDKQVREKALREPLDIIGTYDENRECASCCDVTAINEAVTALIEKDKTNE